jgi:putative methyltransferase (TIGR04325 family)
MVPDDDHIWQAHEGWSHGSIAETQRRKWPEFLASLAGARAVGQSHEATPGTAHDVGPHNTIMCFAYVLGRVAAEDGRVSVLDWGGGVGHYFVYARKLHPELALDYVIKDLPGLCEAGRQLVPDATFISDDAQALSRRYNLVFASSSLHYTRDCYGLLERLCKATGRWLMITRMPFVETHDDFVVVQRPHNYGYMTEYPGWFLNRKRVVEFVTQHGLALEREFLIAERPYVPNAPEQAQYRGLLFRRAET